MLYPSRAPLVLPSPVHRSHSPVLGWPTPSTTAHPTPWVAGPRKLWLWLATTRRRTASVAARFNRKREMYARRTRIFGNRDSLLLCDLEPFFDFKVSGLRFPSRCDQHRDDRSAHNTAFSASKPCEGTSRQQATQTVTAENLDQRIRIRQPSQCIANRPRICATQAVAFTTPQQLRSLSNLQWHGPVDNRDELLGVGQHSGTHVNRSTHLLAKYLIRNLEVIGNGNIDRPPRDGNGRTPCCQWLSQQGLQRIDTTTIPPIRKQRAPAPVAHNTVCKPSHSPSHNGCKSVTPDDDDDRGQPTTETRVLDAGVHDAEMRNAGTLEPALGEHNPDLPTDNWETSTGSCARGTLACATIQKSPFALSLRQLPPSMHSKATAHALEVHDTGSTLIDPKPPPSSTSIARLQITQRCQYGWR
ncbi:hypothetical protein D9611_007981 [Ephemerocybe angulata]|uniref:Uncharacterized protein n=1 Tax=Ephemerocybe angulata TaxID=980116 RepID=A0A8H5CGW9_9AGAR|nr:hypothetical protein D9611_015106 [Tulosesus angulatus]KAF5333877.1 hypothetical protein D9611_014956 [Tulosesus angulatus]KAF5340357.1 hypothetical protein D9611_007981 [Tulosesus angulatus]